MLIARTLQPLADGTAGEPTVLMMLFATEPTTASTGIDEITVDPTFDLDDEEVNRLMERAPQSALFIQTWNEGG